MDGRTGDCLYGWMSGWEDGWMGNWVYIYIKCQGDHYFAFFVPGFFTTELGKLEEF